MSKVYSTSQHSAIYKISMQADDNQKVSKTSVDQAWNKLFEKYDVVTKIKEEQVFYIKASQIKEFKEPRLMAKFDSSQQLPKIFSDNRINILPVSRSGYVLGQFELYQKLPEFSEQEVKVKRVTLPYFETLKVNNITSEANAINALLICHILDDFLGVKGSVETFNGRMGTGSFSFKVDTQLGPIKIEVDKAQCEVDSGLENRQSIVILEAKNVVLPDFHIRQLYYPYRAIKDEVTKPIRLIYSVYSNHIFRLYEYRFADPYNYSSIEFVQQQFYSIEDLRIYFNDIIDVFKRARVLYDDKLTHIADKPPFVQADSFERVISLMECLYREEMTKAEIAEYMQFDIRQADYYFNAGRYLGLFTTERESEDGNSIIKVTLTPRGQQIYQMRYKERQLALVSAMFEHQIFYDVFANYVKTGILLDRKQVKDLINDYKIVDSKSTANRRASSVVGWLKWILHLPQVKDIEMSENL